MPNDKLTEFKGTCGSCLLVQKVWGLYDSPNWRRCSITTADVVLDNQCHCPAQRHTAILAQAPELATVERKLEVAIDLLVGGDECPAGIDTPECMATAPRPCRECWKKTIDRRIGEAK